MSHKNMILPAYCIFLMTDKIMELLYKFQRFMYKFFYMRIHLALQEDTGHCFLLLKDSHGISPRNVPHLGHT